LEPGMFTVGDRFETVERPRPDAPMVYVNRTFFGKPDPVELRWMADLEPLAHDWRAEAAQRLGEVVG
jgi:MOSC domain-containing protein YiiM